MYNSIFFSAQTVPIRSATSLFYFIFVQTAPDLIGPDSSVQFLAQITPMLSVKSLSYLFFLSQTTPGQIGPQSSVSVSNQTRTIRSITLLFCLVFVIDYTQSDRSQQLIMIFGINCTYMINHVIVMFSFHERTHLIKQVLIVKFWFWSRPDLYNRLHHCLVLFSSQTTPDPISHDILVSFLVQTTPIKSIMLLSNLVFVTYHTWFDRS